MPSLHQFTSEKLAQVADKNQRRVLTSIEQRDGIKIMRRGRELISFSCNDYLGLSQHPSVRSAAQATLKSHGAGAASSRLITGNHSLYEQVEQQLASMKQTEAALVFGSGYLANIGLVPALVGKGDLIIADKLVHACLIDGAKLSGAEMKRFKHNDMEHAKKLLTTYRGRSRHCVILTDRVFSMDGDVAPIAALEVLASEFDAWLVSDDAHGLGITAKQKSASERHIQMGTLSKAVGSYGGYVCASQQFIDYLVNSARSLVFSTALPPMVMAASLAALKLIESEPERSKRPVELASKFCDMVGLKMPESAIVPLIVGDEGEALKYAKMLEGEGFLVSAVRPPTVPKGTARLRFTFSALHDERDVLRLAEYVRNNMNDLSKRT